MAVVEKAHMGFMNMTIVVGRNVFIVVQALMDVVGKVLVNITDKAVLVSAGIAVLLVLDVVEKAHMGITKNKKILSSKFSYFLVPGYFKFKGA